MITSNHPLRAGEHEARATLSTNRSTVPFTRRWPAAGSLQRMIRDVALHVGQTTPSATTAVTVMTIAGDGQAATRVPDPTAGGASDDDE
jgi:hypothetical protein